MSDQPKQSTFRRALAKAREARKREKMLKMQIRDAEHTIRSQADQCAKLADTIKRTVKAHVTNHPWQDRITLCVDIDLKTANLHGDDLYNIAMAQLGHAVRAEIQKHRR